MHVNWLSVGKATEEFKTHIPLVGCFWFEFIVFSAGFASFAAIFVPYCSKFVKFRSKIEKSKKKWPTSGMWVKRECDIFDKSRSDFDKNYSHVVPLRCGLSIASGLIAGHYIAKILRTQFQYDDMREKRVTTILSIGLTALFTFSSTKSLKLSLINSSICVISCYLKEQF